MNNLNVSQFDVQELDSNEMMNVEAGGIIKDWLIGTAIDLLVEAGAWILDGGNHIATPEQPLVAQDNTRVVR